MSPTLFFLLYSPCAVPDLFFLLPLLSSPFTMADNAPQADPPSRNDSQAFDYPEYIPTSEGGDDVPNNVLHPSLSHHDPTRPDLSFPFATTNTSQGGFTDEYRTVTRTGYMPAHTALRPIPSHTSVTPPALRDPEKLKELNRTKLVTFVPDDPEDPRNKSYWFKWCTYSSTSVIAPIN